MLSNHKFLGDLLIESGIIGQAQMDMACSVQQKTGEGLEKILVNLGYITEASMMDVLEFQLGVPRVELNAVAVPREIAATIPVALAERYQVIPIKKAERRLTLAMVDPTNFFAIDDVRLVSGCEVEPVIAAASEIRQAISQSYGVRELVEKAVNTLNNSETNKAAGVQVIDDAPIIRIVDSVISRAIKERASDIHIEPQAELLRVRFRVDGVLREAATFPLHIHAALISRIKIMGGLDIAEKRLPQDGRINVQEGGREIDLRVATLPTITGEKMVLRVLDKNTVIFDIKGLGFNEENLALYRRMYSQSYGMLLLTGPTGSGKTTTLYSTLAEINLPGRNIITIENPVEYRLAGVNQVQVNPKAGLNFANGLRSILRQDPNVVMVGEIRDAETADIAIRAALTGHLVFSTLHTNDAPGAVTRLIDMGVEPFLVASSVLGIVAQRLVRVICTECKQEYKVAADSPERRFLGVEAKQQLIFFRGTGCSHCSHTGYFGRMAIHEVMLVSPHIRAAINQQVSSDILAGIAAAGGMKTMRQDGIAKAMAGYTTVEEIMRVAYAGTDYMGESHGGY